MKLALALAMAVVVAVPASAQVEGHITDAESGQPVAFANITIKNKFSGTATNEDGYFRLATGYEPGDTILITHIEFIPDRIPVSSANTQPLKINLRRNTIMLQTVDVVAGEDDKVLEEVIQATKKSMLFPMTQKLYYREIVRENAGYNKFADGLLTVVYPTDKDDLAIKVDQCRAKELPKDSDDMLEMVSPLKIDKILGYQYLTIFDRFIGDNKKDYHFYAMPGPDKTTVIKIEPRKEADRSDSKLLFYASLKSDANMVLQEAAITLDSLCNFDKSLLGFRIRIPDIETVLDFSTVNNHTYLSHLRYTMTLTVDRKDMKLAENFVTEVLTLDVEPVAKVVERKDRFKKSALYKSGSRYDHEFWKAVNMPAFTSEEAKLLRELESK